MKHPTAVALMMLALCRAASACEGLAGGADIGELESRSPVAGAAPRSIVSVGRREPRGDRVWMKQQRAMQYATPPGTPVLAVQGGRVVSAQAHPGHGNALIIDHGAGMSTLYGRLASLDVREGDCVATGAVIGRVGAPDGGGEPTLHFEASADRQFIWPIEPLSRARQGSR
jgi:murein DD-endopeptidase MepM/ murein hydrolase activator NlpD